MWKYRGRGNSKVETRQIKLQSVVKRESEEQIEVPNLVFSVRICNKTVKHSLNIFTYLTKTYLQKIKDRNTDILLFHKRPLTIIWKRWIFPKNGKSLKGTAERFIDSFNGYLGIEVLFMEIMNMPTEGLRVFMLMGVQPKFLLGRGSVIAKP